MSSFGMFALGFSLVVIMIVGFVLYKSNVLGAVRKVEKELIDAYKLYRQDKSKHL